MGTPVALRASLNVAPRVSDAAPSAGKFLALAVEELDLVALGGGACREIRANEAGTLTVTSESGDEVVVPFLAGEKQPIRCTGIIEGSGVSNILVFW